MSGFKVQKNSNDKYIKEETVESYRGDTRCRLNVITAKKYDKADIILPDGRLTVTKNEIQDDVTEYHLQMRFGEVKPDITGIVLDCWYPKGSDHIALAKIQSVLAGTASQTTEGQGSGRGQVAGNRIVVGAIIPLGETDHKIERVGEIYQRTFSSVLKPKEDALGGTPSVTCVLKVKLDGKQIKKDPIYLGKYLDLKITKKEIKKKEFTKKEIKEGKNHEEIEILMLTFEGFESEDYTASYATVSCSYEKRVKKRITLDLLRSLGWVAILGTVAIWWTGLFLLPAILELYYRRQDNKQVLRPKQPFQYKEDDRTIPPPGNA